MQIKVIAVSPEEQKGTYLQYDVTYKDVVKGTTGGKTLRNFAQKEVYEFFKTIPSGTLVDVVNEKSSDGKYWNWTKASVSGEGPATGGNSTPTRKEAFYSSGGKNVGNYESATERATKQRNITRLAVLERAILYYGTKQPAPEAVLSLAEKFEEWTNRETLATATKAIIDMEDDVPQ